MKKFLFLFFGLSLLLSACGGSDEESTPEESEVPYYYTYKTADFEIDVPDTWETLTSFTSEYPEGIRVAFRNNIQESDFIANVNVIRENNKKNLTSHDLAQNKLKDHAETLLNYQLLSQEEIMMSVDGGDSQSTLNTFEGKIENTSTPLQFKQITVAKGDMAWIVTATYLSGEDEFVIERMETMLKSFTLK